MLLGTILCISALKVFSRTFQTPEVAVLEALLVLLPCLLKGIRGWDEGRWGYPRQGSLYEDP